MTKQEFERFITSRYIFLDGATGSNLFLQGMQSGICPEQWILEHSDVLIKLQKDYVKAGSDIIYAPTFGANRWKLEEYGLADSVEKMNKELVGLSKKAADGKAMVAGDLTMTGRQLLPIGKESFEDLVCVYKEQVKALVEANVDLIVIETMMSLQETRAAVLACTEVCDLPVIATLSFQDDGRTLFGTDPITAAVVLEKLGVSAIGVNCSKGPKALAEYVKMMNMYASVPIIAKPNAGLPSLNEAGATVYDLNPKEFVEQMKYLTNNGASLLGGCCGTTPKHIKALFDYFRYKTPIKGEKIRNSRILTSERKNVIITDEGGFAVIGERINPTGKKKLQEELRNSCFDIVTRFAEEQEDCGASILDVNMGMGGIDEKATFLKAMQEIMCVTNLPLSIDSSDCDVIEAALRLYPGRALVNSISLEPNKAERLLPLVKKYGAMFVLLPLSENGLPKSIEEKQATIDKLVQMAIDNGLTKNDLFVDCLVTTVSANRNAAFEALDTIIQCKKDGLATMCGLSNISFGLPERMFINTSFLNTAMFNGLNMAILNPTQEYLMRSIYATDLLMNKDNADINYIEKVSEFSEVEQKRVEELKKMQDDNKAMLRNSIMRGHVDAAQTYVKQCLEEKSKPEDLLNEILLPAINEVGDLFNSGKYYLPQLIASANAMKEAIGILEPLLVKKKRGKNMPKVVIATVKGDIHDIGKNLVALMLKNYGMEVYDLGKDVQSDKIITKALELDADIIALSALMTTTMCEMQNVINLAHTKNVRAKIIVGGAVITKEYSDVIGADGYSKDAADAVKLVQNLLK